MIDARHSPYERRRSDLSTLRGLSPKLAAMIWRLLVILLLAAMILFSWAWLSHNNAGPSGVSCGTETGEPCGKP
jgi:hypothetical protein